MSKDRYDPIQDEGVNAVGVIFTRTFRWIYRSQPQADMGIDAHCEVCQDGKPLGRLLALQIKSGTSWFTETVEGGYVFRGSVAHLDYWTQHSLPVILVLYNPETQKAFWQVVVKKYVVPTEKAWKIVVPYHQELDKSAIEQLSMYAKDSSAIRVLRDLILIKGSQFEESITKMLIQIESEQNRRPHDSSKPLEINGYQLIALQTMVELHKTGIPIDRLRPIYQWFQQETVGQFAIRLVQLGFQAFLVFGADGKGAVWTDSDLADYLFLGADSRVDADIVICLNKIIRDYFKKLGHEIQPIQRTFFHSYQEYIKSVEFIWDEAMRDADKHLKSLNGTEDDKEL